MILLKGFYRKKTTRIYLLLCSILLITIVILFSFINYYISLRDNYFKNNSYILIVSKNDYYSDIIKQDIVKIEKVLLFEPDYTSSIIQKKTLGEHGEMRSDLLYWTDLTIGDEDLIKEYILVVPKEDMKDTEMNIGIYSGKIGNSMVLYNDNSVFKTLTKYNISFYHNSRKLEYTINNIYLNNYPKVQISSNNFRVLYDNSDIYAYKVLVDNEKKAKQTINNLQKNRKNVDDIFYLKTSIVNSDSVLYKVNQIINVLRYANVIILALISLIFLIIINNIIKDEHQSTKTERLLGFKKQQIVKYLSIKLITLCTISFLICIFVSLLVISLLNYIFNLELVSFDLLLLLKVFSVIILLSILTVIKLILKLKKVTRLNI